MLATFTIRLVRLIALFAVCGLWSASFCRAQSQPATPIPNVSLSVNGQPEPVVLQGEALIFTAVLFHPNIFAKSVTPVVINPKSGSWGNTVQILVTDSSGVATAWPLQVVVSPPGALTLDAQQTGILQWVLEPFDAKKIVPGSYQVQAVLDTTTSAGSNGWNGSALSDGALIQITAPTNPTADQMEQQLESQVLSEHLLGNDTQALSDLDQLLIQFPNSVEALELKGRLLNSLGQSKAALQAYEAAIDSFYSQQTTTPQEPPTQLLRPAADLRRAIYGSSSGSSPSPTTVVSSSANLVYSPANQSVSLTATVSSTGGGVSGGSVVFTAGGVGAPVTSLPVAQGHTSVSFLVPGGTKAGNYTLEARFIGTTLFSASSDSTHTLSIGKATPTITWNRPVAVLAGTTLSATQLNATASVPGTFVYHPPAGTVLTGGSAQSLGVNFTPTDSADYNPATASVVVGVTAPRPGDLNKDGVVNCADMAIVKASFGKKTGQPGFDVRADVNGDGVVNVLDLSFVAKQLPAGTACK